MKTQNLITRISNKRKNKFFILNQIASLVRDKGKVKISELAMRFGYSRHYFRYHIVPVILDIFNDIKLSKIDGTEYLVHFGESEIERKAREEAEEVLEAKAEG